MYILTKNVFASKAYLIFYYWVYDIIAKVVWILNNLSKCKQFNASGLGSYSFCENMDLVFLDFAVLVILPDLFILEEVAPLDFDERGPFLSAGFLD